MKGTLNELEYTDCRFRVHHLTHISAFLKMNVLHLFGAAAGQESSVSCISGNDEHVLNVAKQDFQMM